MSGHCHDDHDHSAHSHAGGHDHSDDITPALQFSLYQHINFDDITTLNEAEAGSGKAIVKKTWAERLRQQPELESDADEQLLMHIPYAFQVTLGSPFAELFFVASLAKSNFTPYFYGHQTHLQHHKPS